MVECVSYLINGFGIGVAEGVISQVPSIFFALQQQALWVLAGTSMQLHFPNPQAGR
jgi:hypothetical protein